ncbi:MAG: calcium-binding protein [Pseudomonadota bacterium]
MGFIMANPVSVHWDDVLNTAYVNMLYRYHLKIAGDANVQAHVEGESLPVWMSLRQDAAGHIILSGTPRDTDVQKFNLSIDIYDNQNGEIVANKIIPFDIRPRDISASQSLNVQTTKGEFKKAGGDKPQPYLEAPYEFSATDVTNFTVIAGSAVFLNPQVVQFIRPDAQNLQLEQLDLNDLFYVKAYNGLTNTLATEQTQPAITGKNATIDFTRDITTPPASDDILFPSEEAADIGVDPTNLDVNTTSTISTMTDSIAEDPNETIETADDPNTDDTTNTSGDNDVINVVSTVPDEPFDVPTGSIFTEAADNVNFNSLDPNGFIFPQNVQDALAGDDIVVLPNSMATADIFGYDFGQAFSGGAGNDTISGGAQADTILGDSGNDNISGAGNDDFLDGGSGIDNVLGDAGNDILVFDNVDSLNGGADTDTLLFNASNTFNVATSPGNFTNFEVVSLNNTGSTIDIGSAVTEIVNLAGGANTLTITGGNTDSVNFDLAGPWTELISPIAGFELYSPVTLPTFELFIADAVNVSFA